jgi:hypothetical protein
MTDSPRIAAADQSHAVYGRTMKRIDRVIEGLETVDEQP